MESTEILVTIVSCAISSVLSLLVGVLVYKIQKVDKRREEKEQEQRETSEAIKEGLQSILRDRIIYLIQKAESEGYAPIYNVQNITRMYAAYHTLGGNGTITQLYEHFKRLPHVPPQEGDATE